MAKTKITIAEEAAKERADADVEAEKKGRKKINHLALPQRYARDSLIVQRVAEGVSFEQIGEEVDLTTRQVRNIAKQISSARELTLLKKDPLDIVEWMLEEHLRSFQGHRAKAMISTGPEYTTAMKAADASMERIMKILQATGKLPRELGTLRYIVDFRGIAQAMIQKVEELERGECEPGDVMEFLKHVLRIGDTPLELEGSVAEANVVEEEVA